MTVNALQHHLKLMSQGLGIWLSGCRTCNASVRNRFPAPFKTQIYMAASLCDPNTVELETVDTGSKVAS